MTTKLTVDWKSQLLTLQELPQKPLLRWFVDILSGSSFSFNGDAHMAFTLPDDKTAVATLTTVDAKGNPAPVQAVSWESSDPSILEVTADPVEPSKASIKPVGPLGQAQVRANLDPDTTMTGDEFIVLGDIEVVAGKAVSGTVSISLA